MVQGVADAEHHVEAGVVEVAGQLIPGGSYRPQRSTELLSQLSGPTNHGVTGVGRDNLHAETSETYSQLPGTA